MWGFEFFRIKNKSFNLETFQGEMRLANECVDR